MNQQNVAEDIDTFLATFAESEGMELAEITDVINQVIQYTQDREYSKDGLYGMILHGWIAGFMAGYRHGKHSEL